MCNSSAFENDVYAEFVMFRLSKKQFEIKVKCLN